LKAVENKIDVKYKSSDRSNNRCQTMHKMYKEILGFLEVPIFLSCAFLFNLTLINLNKIIIIEVETKDNKNNRKR